MTSVAIPCLNCRATTHVAADAQSANCQTCGFAMPPPGSPSWMASRDGGQPFGPYDINQVATYLAQGQILATDGLWHQGAQNWVPAGQLPALAVGGQSNPAQPQAQPAQPDPYNPYGQPGQPYGGHPGQPHGGQPGYDPYGQPQGGGAFGGANPYAQGGFGRYVKRAFDWNLRHLEVDQAERANLLSKGVHDENAQRYLVWRRSILLVIMIPMGISALLAVIGLFTINWQGLSAMGVLTQLLRVAGLFVLPVTAYLASQSWDNQRKSRRVLLFGWAIALGIPLLLALIPAGWLFNMQGANPLQRAEMTAMLSVVGAIGAFVALMPTVLSVIPGVLRGCLRIKALLPNSILPGLFLVAATPLYVMLFLVVFTIVNQIAGNFLLILGVLALAASPVIYLFHSGTFTRPLRSEQEFAKIGAVQNQAMIVMGIGLALIVLYALTATLAIPGRGEVSLIGTNAQTSMMRPWDPNIFQFPLEYISRSLFTTAAVADLFMLMNLALWKNSKVIEGTPEGQAYDHVMANIEEIGGAGLVEGQTVFRSRGQQ